MVIDEQKVEAADEVPGGLLGAPGAVPVLDPLPHVLGHEVVERPVDSLDEEVGLCAEMSEHQRLGHAGTGGYLPGGDVFVAVLVEELPSGAQDQRADSRRAASGPGVLGHSTMMTDDGPSAGADVHRSN